MKDRTAIALLIGAGVLVWLRRRRPASPTPPLGGANAVYLAGPGRLPYGE